MAVELVQLDNIIINGTIAGNLKLLNLQIRVVEIIIDKLDLLLLINLHHSLISDNGVSQVNLIFKTVIGTRSIDAGADLGLVLVDFLIVFVRVVRLLFGFLRFDYLFQ